MHLKDKKHHGALDKSTSKQRICVLVIVFGHIYA